MSLPAQYLQLETTVSIINVEPMYFFRREILLHSYCWQICNIFHELMIRTLVQKGGLKINMFEKIKSLSPQSGCISQV